MISHEYRSCQDTKRQPKSLHRSSHTHLADHDLFRGGRTPNHTRTLSLHVYDAEDGDAIFSSQVETRHTFIFQSNPAISACVCRKIEQKDIKRECSFCAAGTPKFAARRVNVDYPDVVDVVLYRKAGKRTKNTKLELVKNRTGAATTGTRIRGARTGYRTELAKLVEPKSGYCT